MTTNDYISSLHIEILHLNKNYFNKTNEENTTTDITNNGKIRSKSNTINDKKKMALVLEENQLNNPDNIETVNKIVENNLEINNPESPLTSKINYINKKK